MKNPCGSYKGGMKNPIAGKSSSGKLLQILGKKGESRKYIVGDK